MRKPIEHRVTVLVEDYAGYNTQFLAQHGLSILIETFYDDGSRVNVLFDTGSSSTPLLRNARLMNIDLSSINYIVLSHSHIDHTGGLVELVRSSGLKAVVVAHPKIFKKSYAYVNGKLVYAGAPPSMKEEVEEAGCTWLLTKDPVAIAPGIYTTGSISISERIEFEREGDPNLYYLRGDSLARDYVEDEIGLVIEGSGGLTLVAGCSHPGIVSMCLKASRVYGRSVERVIGGLHLIGAGYERIRATIVELYRRGVREVHAGHCTGFDAECMFKMEFKGLFRKIHCGYKVTIR